MQRGEGRNLFWIIIRILSSLILNELECSVDDDEMVLPCESPSDVFKEQVVSVFMKMCYVYQPRRSAAGKVGEIENGEIYFAFMLCVYIRREMEK